MNTCDAIQKRLAEEGAAVAQLDADIRRHLKDCAACTRWLEELTRLDAELRQWPSVEPPDSLVADTLHAVRHAAGGGHRPIALGLNRRWLAGALAASVVIAAAIGLTQSFLPYPADWADFQTGLDNGRALPDRAAGRLSSLDVLAERAPEEADAEGEVAAAKPAQRNLEAGKADAQGAVRRSAPQPAEDQRFRNESDRIALLQKRLGETRSLNKIAATSERQAAQAPARRAKSKGDDLHRAPAGPENAPVGGSYFYGSERSARLKRADVAKSGSRALALDEKNRALPARDKDSLAEAFADDDGRRRNRAGIGGADPSRLAATFLTQIASLDGLSFTTPIGYWANTYIPGDPAMRLLLARLRAWDRATLGPPGRLEQAARHVRQPFDTPENSALAVYLHADASGIQGPTRLRLQVGLKGAERQGGHRPAMNVGLVVDLRANADETITTRVRALITALDRARQTGDRFSLTVAGPGGGLLVAPDQFRHGALRVAMDRLFGAAKGANGRTVDLMQAVSLASQSVRQGDDPSAIFGSSLVLLATGSPIAGDLAALERMAHDNAIGGVSLSIVSLGARAELDQIDRLVAAGQGNRRILQSADRADALIDRELHAASRAVARAVRLRIRLQPGVKLVDVLGSRRLEQPQAARVREAEQAIDQRLARNLGIQADRGDDEEGIQIVIPNFHAGDAHVVLLDVVVERPGPIADVTVRYKDVVYLRNGVARASLALGAGAQAPGPLERNVLKNLVALEFSARLRQIGQYLKVGYSPTALAELAELRQLIRGLRLAVAGWSTDPELAADEAMLSDYLAVLNAPAAGDVDYRNYLADSLRYAAFRKLHAAAE